MEQLDTILPYYFYVLHLKKVNSVDFTQREIDVMTCLLKGRSSKKISSFLNMSPRTVETHVRNIMHKIESHSRENIVDFIEKSSEYESLKFYYSLLLTHEAFEKILKKACDKNEKRKCTLVYSEELNKEEQYLLKKIKQHLTILGIIVLCKMKRHLDSPESFQNSKEEDVLYIISNRDLERFPEFFKLLIQEKNYNSCVVLLNPGIERIEKSFPFPITILNSSTAYYSGFFELLKKLFPYESFHNLVTEFMASSGKEHHINQGESTATPSSNNLAKWLQGGKLTQFFPYKKAYGWGTVLILIVCLLSIFSFKKEAITPPFKSIESRESHLVRSDLAAPSESTLLHRPELMQQIADHFKNNTGIQTVALLGPGGAGKTTLARQYVLLEQAAALWEINSETEASIKEAFEHLAQALAKTPEDQREFKEIKEIRNPNDKEEKIFLFVRDLLKSHSNWILIFDNVEEFSNIQKYFPHDSLLWGNGKIFITTQNNHIQDLALVNHTIQVGDLTPNEKLELFSKIMKGKARSVSCSIATSQEKVVKFLEKIPPYPLDVSIAAYYLKATNICYQQYINHLNEYKNEFSLVQQNLLKESGDYSKTRYGIITLAVKELLEAHKDFIDLLLLISLLDSQNIPKELLDFYKNDIVVENFIYFLNKYSLVTNKSPISLKLDAMLSIHQSTQNIIIYPIKLKVLD